ncbi:aurora kinase-like, partial [Centruroides vittatus]|uniref:aurora kinase-like n=1 Tax=Centruroides vittatus TaxID=120091 RepID=UPI00350EF7D0
MFRCAEKVVLRISRNKMKKESRREDSEPSVQENKDYPFQNDKDSPATKCDSSKKGESQLQANNPKKGKFMGYLKNLFHKCLLCCFISGEISYSETYKPKNHLAGFNLGHDCVDKPKKFIDKYKITKEIGRGKFGTVYLAKTQYSKKKKAVKIVKKELSHSDQREINVWNSVFAHPNIVRFIRFFQTDTIFCFVSDFVEGESLRNFVQKYGLIAESKAKVFAALVASVIMYIHKNGIIHGDISANNIMLDVYKGAQVIDFGLSTFERNPTKFCGTLSFLCPEILQIKPYDSYCDWWAFAIVLFQALVGRTPLQIYVKEAFNIDNVYLFPLAVAAVNVPVSYPATLSDDARHFINDLLQK